jgi:hypothetical protein
MILSTCMRDSRRGSDWIFDVLTTYKCYSELQAITAPLLIFKILKSSQHSLSLFQPAVSSPAVPWQRLVTMNILQLPTLRSPLNDGSLITASFSLRLAHMTDPVPPILFLITPLHGPSSKHCFQKYSYCCIHIRCRGNAFTEPRNGSDIFTYLAVVA